MAESDAQEKIQRLQLMEQNLQQLLAQKQQFQAQVFELDKALKELKDTSEAYKIIGNIMVKSDRAELEKDVQQRKELADLRVQTLDKQEKQIRDKAQSLQKDVMALLKKE